ncbi:ParB family protein [Commensalibacter nepenthis]|uniref:ParB family protein n=1 Tax=Commensalibacter nepenthis TaxID=3043872 RepID=A0ABT6QA94_9PROT|nr:ParB family protein [Commensalibacter sp. TBRC 10068]MDI2113826.1 ParB family protein [Commensalibacter sp. TBRC 10068]
MSEIERGTNKNLYIHGHKRTSFEQKNNLSSLKKTLHFKRSFTFSNGRKVEAKHVIIPGNKIVSNTVVHTINPRNQTALDRQSVRDIIEQIRERGVDKEGIAIQHQDKYYLIEGSRRRYCCIETQQDLPLWVITDELNSKEIYEIINASQSSKKFSYREVGKQYLKQMQELGFTTNDDLAAYLNTSSETIRKRIQAAKINEHLIQIFPDAEGIPNSYYSKLAKIEKEAEKNNLDIPTLCQQLRSEVNFETIETIEEQQQYLIHHLTMHVKNMMNQEKEIIWETRDLVTFSNKDQYARISRNSNGRKVKFEFNRMNINTIKEIEQMIIHHLNKKEKER